MHTFQEGGGGAVAQWGIRGVRKIEFTPYTMYSNKARPFKIFLKGCV